MSDAAEPLKLQRRSSGEMVADHLRREIFAGRLAPGDRIPQEEVATALGVSRIPVREALVILEGEGRVRLEHQRGAFVLPTDVGSVRDNAEIFGMVYGFVARRSAEHRTPALEDRLKALSARLEEAQKPEVIWQLAEAYLDTILEMGTAPRLARILRRMRTLAVDNLFEVVPKTHEIVRTGTISLIDAILAGEPERAEAIQMDMQRRSADLVVAEFESLGMLHDDRGKES